MIGLHPGGKEMTVRLLDLSGICQRGSGDPGSDPEFCIGSGVQDRGGPSFQGPFALLRIRRDGPFRKSGNV